MSNKLWCDLITPQEKLEFLESGCAVESGIIAPCLVPEIIRTLKHLIIATNALGDICMNVPCVDEGGGCFYPMYDDDGVYLGETPVDPLSVVGSMRKTASDALGQIIEETKMQLTDNPNQGITP